MASHTRMEILTKTLDFVKERINFSATTGEPILDPEHSSQLEAAGLGEVKLSPDECGQLMTVITIMIVWAAKDNRARLMAEAEQARDTEPGRI